MPTALPNARPAGARTLDWQHPQQVRYCVENFVRDENIKRALARVPGRLQPGKRRSEPIAVVGFGPSLTDTWEKIKEFEFVFSCSGAHKFLVEHGIIPSWHCDVDPRPHKAALIGPPQKDTTYLIASACHPAVFDHLDGFTVLLWHIFDATDAGIRALPPGEWAVTGGCDAGLRAMTLAGFLGFRDLHIFGMDGCGRPEAAGSHAAVHPNAVKKYATCDYHGVTYHTTPALLEAARQVWHELDQMPAVKAKFYGDGLIQAMAADYRPRKRAEPSKFENVVGFCKPELISAEYRELNARLHRENIAYGVGGEKHADTVLKLCKALKTKDVLDYGCGKGRLQRALPFHIQEYDPAIPGKEESPKPADVVIASDVLEHCEPDKLAAVLADLQRVTRQVAYLVIHTGPAQKTLANGANTHAIQKGRRWWATQLKKFFVMGKIIEHGKELHIVVGPKPKAA